jgi:hypothetical protein
VLTLAGNAIGRSPYYQVESSRHRSNLFAVLVGDSSKSRKGTSFERTKEIVKVSDETWSGDRIKGGLSSSPDCVITAGALYSATATVLKRSATLSTRRVTGTKYMTAAKATVTSQAAPTVQFGYRALITKSLGAVQPSKRGAHRALGTMAPRQSPRS